MPRLLVECQLAHRVGPEVLLDFARIRPASTWEPHDHLSTRRKIWARALGRPGRHALCRPLRRRRGCRVQSGGVYATTTLVGWSVNAAVKTMSDDTFGHRVFPELIHAADDAGYVIHAAGGIGIGTLMIATSVVTMRAGRIPGWAGWVGICSASSRWARSSSSRSS